MATRTEKDLLNGKINAVKKALKKAKVYLPTEAFETLEKELDANMHYEIEVVRDAKVARKSLMMDFSSTECPDECDCSSCMVYGMVTYREEGKVVYGDAFCGDDYSTYSYINGVKVCVEDCTVKEMFSPKEPFILVLKRERRYMCCDQEGGNDRSYHIVIYVPRRFGMNAS